MIYTLPPTVHGLHQVTDDFCKINGFLLLKKQSGNYEIIMRDDPRAQALIATLPTYHQQACSDAKTSADFVPSGYTKISSIHALLEMIPTVERVWGDGVTRETATFVTHRNKKHWLADDSGITAQARAAYKARRDTHNDPSSIQARKDRAILYTALHVEDFDITNYNNSVYMIDLGRVKALQQDVRAFCHQTFHAFVNANPVFPPQCFFRIFENQNRFSLQEQGNAEKFGKVFGYYYAGFSTTLSDTSSDLDKALEMINKIFRFATDQATMDDQESVLDFMRYICFDGAFLAPLEDIQYRFDMLEFILNIGAAVAAGAKNEVGCSSERNGWKIIESIYKGVTFQLQSRSHGLFLDGDGFVMFWNQRFTWHKTAEAEQFLMELFSKGLHDLNAAFAVPDLSAFYKLTEKNTLISKRYTLVEAVGVEQNDTLISDLGKSWRQCKNLLYVEKKVNYLVSLAACVLAWAGCFSVTIAELNSYSMAESLPSLHYQADCITLESYDSRASAFPDCPKMLKVLPGDTGLVLLYTAVILKRIQAKLVEKKVSYDSHAVFPPEVQYPNSWSNDKKQRAFVEDHLFVDTVGMKFCNHTGNFLKYQPWTENHKLSLDDYCVVVGGLQRSNKYFPSVAVKFQGVLGAMYKGPEKEASLDFLEMKLFVDHLQERAGLPCRYGLKRQVLPVEPADLQLKSDTASVYDALKSLGHYGI